MTPPIPACSNERLNTIIAVGLLVVLAICLIIYAMIYMSKGQPDGQLVQLAGTIAGGLVGFIARGLTHGTTVQAGPEGTVNVGEQPEETPGP